jgi:hypothetical protein
MVGLEVKLIGIGEYFPAKANNLEVAFGNTGDEYVGEVEDQWKTWAKFQRAQRAALHMRRTPLRFYTCLRNTKLQDTSNQHVHLKLAVPHLLRLAR